MFNDIYLNNCATFFGNVKYHYFHDHCIRTCLYVLIVFIPLGISVYHVFFLF